MNALCIVLRQLYLPRNGLDDLDKQLLDWAHKNFEPLKLYTKSSCINVPI